MAAQLMVGAAILLSLNRACWWLGIGVLALIGTYPFMKRVHLLAAALSSGSISIGAPCSAGPRVTGALAWPSALLYLGGIFWNARLRHDLRAPGQGGTTSASVSDPRPWRWASGTRPWLFVFYAAALVLWVAAGIAPGSECCSGPGSWAPGRNLPGRRLGFDINDPADCLAKFRSNRVTGWLLFAGIVAGHFA